MSRYASLALSRQIKRQSTSIAGGKNQPKIALVRHTNIKRVEQMAITVTVKEVMEKGSVGIPDAQQILGCGKTVLYDMLKKNVLPFVRVNSQRKIPVAAIEKYLAERLVQG